MTARLRVRALLCAEGDSDVHVQHWDVCCVYWKSWKAELKRWVRCWLSEGGFRTGYNWERRSRHL